MSNTGARPLSGDGKGLEGDSATASGGGAPDPTGVQAPPGTCRTPEWLTLIVLPLAALASAGGLLLPRLYREPVTVLIKATAMGLALLAMNRFAKRAGQPRDAVELLAFYTVLAAGGLSLSLWFFRHCRR